MVFLVLYIVYIINYIYNGYINVVDYQNIIYITNYIFNKLLYLYLKSAYNNKSLNQDRYVLSL